MKLVDHLKQNNTKVSMNIFDKEEIYSNCTVQVLTNSVTGEVSIGWWKNDRDILEILKSNIRLSDAVVAGEDVILIEGTGSVIKNSREHNLLKEWLENDK